MKKLLTCLRLLALLLVVAPAVQAQTGSSQATASGLDINNPTATVTVSDITAQAVTSLLLTTNNQVNNCGSWYEYQLQINGTDVGGAFCNETDLDLSTLVDISTINTVSVYGYDADNYAPGDSQTVDITLTATWIASTATDFESFSFAQETGSATINVSNHTIAIETSLGTDLTNLTPSFSLSAGASVAIGANAQESGVTTNDFSSPVTYSVTAEDGTTMQDWMVNVTEAAGLSEEKDILTFSINGVDGVIGENTISVDLSGTEDITALTSYFTSSAFSTVSVSGTDQQNGVTTNDYSSGVAFTVTAQDGTIKHYNVTVMVGALISISPLEYLISADAGTSSNIAITIENTGDSPLTISEVGSITAPFSTTYTGSVIAAGGSEMIPVTFSPPTEGYYASNLSFTTDATNASPTISLAGSSGVYGILGGTTTGQALPIEPYYGYTYSESIYYASELGFGNSFVTKVSFEYVGGVYTDDVKVYLGHTSKTAFDNSSDWVTSGGMEMVFDGSVNLATGLVEITLDTPFFYNGTDNLVIGVDENSSGYHNDGDEFFCHNGPANVSMTYFADNTNPDPASPPTANGSSPKSTRPNMLLTATPAPVESDILTFSMTEQTGAATIDNVNHTIALEVSNGTDLTGLVAEFTLSLGASLNIGATAQESGVTSNDYSSPVVYTVSDYEGGTQDWMVNVTAAAGLSDEKDILTFSINGVDGVIGENTISVDLSGTEDITALVPNFTSSAFSSVAVSGTDQESGVTANDFSSGVAYSVTAQDGTIKHYNVTVTVGALISISPLEYLMSADAGSNTNIAITIENTGDSPLTISEVGSITAPFSTTYTGSVIAAGGSEMIPVTFSPPTEGYYTSDLSFTTDAANASPTISLVGSSGVYGIAGGTTTGQGLPIEPYYGYTYSESIYYASELGFGNSFVSKVAFEYTGGSYTDDVKVYMGHTSKTAFDNSSDWVSSGGMEMVFDGTVNLASGWVEITLDTPFFYNGTDNLVIGVDENSSGYHNNVDEFFCHTGPANVSMTYFADSTNPDPASPPTANGSSPKSARPNMLLTATPAPVESDILTFSMAEQTGAATIDNGNHTIALEVSNGTDLTGLVAEFTLSLGASLNIGATAQESGVTSNDYSSPVVYTVSDYEGGTQDWMVNVTAAASQSDEKDILTFSINGVDGVIGANTITVDLTGTVDVSALVADFTSSAFSSVAVSGTDQESGVTANDYGSGVPYTVTAQDGTTKNYNVTVMVGALISISPLEYMTSVDAGSSSNIAITIENTGDSPLTISEVGSITAPFSTTYTGSVIAAGGSEMIPVTFSPPTEGYYTSDLSFTTDAANASPTISLVGTAGVYGIAGGTTTGQGLPIEPYYGYTYSESIYYAAELGLSNSLVNTVSFEYTGGSYSDDVKVYMGHTSKTAFDNSSDWVSSGGMEMVFDGTVNLASGWVEITLDTPFFYNGADNLVIGVDENSSGYHNSVDEFFCHTGPANVSMTYFADSTNPDPASPPTANGSSPKSARPNMLLTATPATAATNILSFSMAEQTGAATINDANHTVDIEVANGTDLTSLTATFSLSSGATAMIGASAQESGTTSNDFSTALTYTVSDFLGGSQDWTVTVTEYIPPVLFYITQGGAGTMDGLSEANAAAKIGDVIGSAVATDSVIVISGVVVETANLTIPAGVVVHAIGGSTIDMGTNNIINNGHVTIGRNSSIVQGTGSTVGGTGNFEIVRTSGSSTSAFNFVSSPISNINVQTVFGGSNVVYFDLANQNNGTEGWTYVTSGNLVNAKGYAVNGASISGFSGNRNHIGHLNNGDISIGLDGTLYGELYDQWNLIGNPYPSVVSIESFITDNPDFGAVVFYDQASNTYLSYNSINYDGVMIPSGQAFYVQYMTGLAGTANFTNSMRQSGAGTIQKTASIAKSKLTITDASGDSYNTYVAFTESASDGFDMNYDAELIPGANEVTLFTMFDETRETIQSFGPLTSTKSVLMGIESGLGLHSIMMTQFENFPSDVTVHIVDNETGAIHDLINDGEYSFIASIDGVVEDRFELIYSRTGLSVDESVFEELTVSYNNQTILLNGLNNNIQTIELLDVTGKLIANWSNVSVDNGTANLTLDAQPVGTYMIVVRTDTDNLVHKFNITR